MSDTKRDVNREIDRLIKRADALRSSDSHAQLIEIRKMVALLEAMPDGSKVREQGGRIVLPRDKRDSVTVDEAMTRDKDPTTSFEAADSVAARKQMTHVLEVLNYFAYHYPNQPVDDTDILRQARVMQFHDTPQGLRSRRATAIQLGWVERVDRYGMSGTGRRAWRYQITDAGRRELNRRYGGKRGKEETK